MQAVLKLGSLNDPRQVGLIQFQFVLFSLPDRSSRWDPTHCASRHLMLPFEAGRWPLLQPLGECPGRGTTSLVGGRASEVESLDVQLLQDGRVVKWKRMETTSP